MYTHSSAHYYSSAQATIVARTTVVYSAAGRYTTVCARVYTRASAHGKTRADARVMRGVATRIAARCAVLKAPQRVYSSAAVRTSTWHEHIVACLPRQ